MLAVIFGRLLVCLLFYHFVYFGVYILLKNHPFPVFFKYNSCIKYTPIVFLFNISHCTLLSILHVEFLVSICFFIPFYDDFMYFIFKKLLFYFINFKSYQSFSPNSFNLLYCSLSS